MAGLINKVLADGKVEAIPITQITRALGNVQRLLRNHVQWGLYVTPKNATADALSYAEGSIVSNNTHKYIAAGDIVFTTQAPVGGATAVANLGTGGSAGKVVSITVTDPGNIDARLYPPVKLILSGGTTTGNAASGVGASFTVDANTGKITGCTLPSATTGTSYTVAPTATIIYSTDVTLPSSGGGTVTATLGADADAGKITGFSVDVANTINATTYKPRVYLYGGTTTGTPVGGLTPATFTINGSGVITGITLAASIGTGYTVAPTVKIMYALAPPRVFVYIPVGTTTPAYKIYKPKVQPTLTTGDIPLAYLVRVGSSETAAQIVQAEIDIDAKPGLYWSVKPVV